MHAALTAGQHARRLYLGMVAMLTLVLSGSAAVPFAAAASSGAHADRSALLDLAMHFAPSPALTRAIDGTDAISYGRRDPRHLTFLLLGSDLRPSQNVFSFNERTDMIIVLTINRRTKKMAAASIPRDMAYIPRPGQRRYTGRINELFRHYMPRSGYNRGRALEKVKNVVAHLLDTEIDYVAFIRFASFERMLDRLGPVRVRNPRAIRDPQLIDSGNPVGVYFPAASSWLLVGSPTAAHPKCSGWFRFGPNTGQPGYECHRALMYARTRKGRGNSDFKRQRRGVDIVMAAISKALANGRGGRLGGLVQTARGQHRNNFYSSLPMTLGNATGMYDLLRGATLTKRIVFRPTRYASRIRGSAKYRINVRAVRTWIRKNFRDV